VAFTAIAPMPKPRRTASPSKKPAVVQPKPVPPAPAPQSLLDFNQVLIRLAEPLPAAPTPMFSNTTAEALGRLVAVLQDLRSPNGWDPTIPQTPENLLPYVTDEAIDLLETVEADLDAQCQSSPVTSTAGSQQSSPAICQPLEHWAPHLLWSIARSSYRTMRLLEGAIATVQLSPAPGYPAPRPKPPALQQGILRLAALLEMEMEGVCHTWDLITQQQPLTPRPPLAAIYACESQHLPQSIPADAFLQRLQQQIISIAPELEPLLIEVSAMAPAGTCEAAALIPGREWQTVQLRLRLELEFLAMDCEPGDKHCPSVPAPGNDSILHFTDLTWLEAYRETLLRQYWMEGLPQLLGVEAITQTPPPTTEEILPQLIQAACQVADQQAVWLEAQPLLQIQPHLSAVAPMLLWRINRSAYETMQMLGGGHGQLLCPGADWETGSLRLVARLLIKTTDHDWSFDLTSNQLSNETAPLMQQGIAQFLQGPYANQTLLVESLLAQIHHELLAQAPELQHLMDGTGVDWLTPEAELSAGLQLQLGFELMR
jgi:hypothetical protein